MISHSVTTDIIIIIIIIPGSDVYHFSKTGNLQKGKYKKFHFWSPKFQIKLALVADK